MCEDTGEKDFTLRRRGTRDYTHSIKRNHCSHKINSAYSVGSVGGNNNTASNYIAKSTSTLGRGSPNYAGSIFGDSAIEEDISIGNYPIQYNTSTQRMIVPSVIDERKPSSTLNRSASNDPRKMIIRLQQNSVQEKQKIYVPGLNPSQPSTLERDKCRIISGKINGHTPSDYSSRIVINSPQRHSIISPNSITSHETDANNYNSLRRDNTHHLPSYLNNHGPEHICWRKYTNNTEEFSTEL